MYHTYQPIDFTQRVFRTTRGKDLAHIFRSPAPQRQHSQLGEEAGGTRAGLLRRPKCLEEPLADIQHRCEVARLRFIRGFAISAATLVTTATPG